MTALSDKLLGDGEFKLLASGGEDCTVRLWSMSTRGKNHPLISTFHGHEKALSLLSVARYIVSNHLNKTHCHSLTIFPFYKLQEHPFKLIVAFQCCCLEPLCFGARKPL